MVDVIPTPKKNVILDATMLSSLMACARFGDLRFNHRFTTSKGRSNSLEVGTLIHKVLEVFYKHQINGFPRTTSIGSALTAGQLFITGCPHCADGQTDKPECKHSPGEYPGLQNTPEMNERYTVGWRFALETCQQYFDFYKNDAFIPLSAEQVKGEVLYEDDEIRVMWKAKFDLILDTNQIGIVSMDHKTFKQRRDKTLLSNQFIGQCLLLKSRNVMVNKIGLQTSLKIDERLTREVVSYSADKLLEWQSEILPYYAYKFVQFSETGYWPPNYTHCDTMFGPCMFKPMCEADKNMWEEVLRNEFQIAPIWDPTNKSDE
jgi:hypothetical protein